MSLTEMFKRARRRKLQNGKIVSEYELEADQKTRTLNLSESTDKAEFVLGLCEGEIEGLEKGPQSFYIGGTRLENVNEESNFEDFSLELYTGSEQDTELLYYLGGAARQNSVGVQLSYNEPVVRQTQSGDIDFIEIRAVIQQLMLVNDDGTQPWSVNLRVEFKAISEEKWHSPTENNLEDFFILSGKITASTVQEFRIELPRIDEPYEIRLTKLSEDGKDEKHMNIIQWESFQEGVLAAKKFPNTALAHGYFQYSNQISSIPSFYGIYKLMKIRVPSNYDPINHTYDGEWDGTFKIAWSDNPAWCLYDFIMNDRYGVNAFCQVTLDKWDAYEAGQWCDEMVTDGRGGKQPRFTCNLLQTESTQGREFAIYLAGLFNAVLVEESTGYLRLKVDKDDDAVFLFTPENITEDGFSYSFTSPETRYNDITVTFMNPELEWQEDRRIITNNEDIALNGRVTESFVAVGCIREGEALRRAYYRMITALTEKTTVTFATNRQAQVLSNFDIILIADPILGYSLPGRIKSLSEDRKTVYLRDSIYLEAGVSYKVQFNVPEGIFETEIEPVSGSGSLYQFMVKSPLPENLPPLAAFTVSGSARSGTPKPFRVVNIAESEGNPDIYQVTAIELNRNKWEAADNLTFAGDNDFSGLPAVTDIPHVLDVSFFESYDKVKHENQLTIGMSLDLSYPYYSGGMVVYSREIGEEVWVKRVVYNDNTLTGHPAGDFEFIILPTSTTGLTPPFSTAPVFKYTVENTADAPSNVNNLDSFMQINGIQLTWDAVPDMDLNGYEIRDGDSWDTGKVITTNYNGNSLFVGLKDHEDHTFWICAQNYAGLYSKIPAQTVVSVLNPDDVTEFYATINKDSVRFDWKQVDGIDIEYVIRQGSNWNTAIEVARTTGNNITILLPSNQETAYSIKALSPAGKFSKNPRYARLDVELYPNRNVIIEVDNAADGFPGITYGFEPVTYLEKTMVMKEEYSYAEHYFPVVLDRVTRARNWFETEAFSFGKRLTWEDMHYRYSQPEAHRTWINSKELDSDGEIEVVILIRKEQEDYNNILGFTYNETMEDLTGNVSPSYRTNITYADSKFTKGLYIGEGTRADYTSGVNIPKLFNMTLKMKMDGNCPQNMLLMSLHNGEQYLQLFVTEGQLQLRGSDRKIISFPINWAKDVDFASIGINQSDTERSLYFFASYGNILGQGTIEAEPIGIFTEYYIQHM